MPEVVAAAACGDGAGDGDGDGAAIRARREARERARAHERAVASLPPLKKGLRREIERLPPLTPLQRADGKRSAGPSEEEELTSHALSFSV
jgi:hypothetical protein